MESSSIETSPTKTTDKPSQDRKNRYIQYQKDLFVGREARAVWSYSIYLQIVEAAKNGELKGVIDFVQHATDYLLLFTSDSILVQTPIRRDYLSTLESLLKRVKKVQNTVSSYVSVWKQLEPVFGFNASDFFYGYRDHDTHHLKYLNTKTEFYMNRSGVVFFYGLNTKSLYIKSFAEGELGNLWKKFTRRKKVVIPFKDVVEQLSKPSFVNFMRALVKED